MSAPITAQCDFCRRVEPALESDAAAAFRDSHPNYDLAVRNARFFENEEGRTLLHHACESMQAATDTPYWIRGKYWWACHEPERPLDSDAFFELYCDACFKRWAGEDPRLAPAPQ